MSAASTAVILVDMAATAGMVKHVDKIGDDCYPRQAGWQSADRGCHCRQCKLGMLASCCTPQCSCNTRQLTDQARLGHEREAAQVRTLACHVRLQQVPQP